VSAAGSAAANRSAPLPANRPALGPDRPLTILHITSPAPVGGLERVVQLLAAGHVADGHQVHVVAVLGPGDDARPFLEPLLDAGVTVHPLALAGRAYLDERRRVRALAAALAPDVVHTHGYRPDVLDAPVARAAGVPTLTTVHGFTGGDARNRVYEWLQRRAFQRFDAVVAVSEPLVALLAAGLAWAYSAYRTTTGRQRLRAVAVVSLAYVLAIGGAVAARAVTHTSQPTDTITVGMVQGNVDGVGLEAFGRARSVTNNHMSETVTLMAQARAGLLPVPDFVLWPENSTDIDPILDTETKQVVSTATKIAGVPILVGAVTDGPGAYERQTTALWWDPVTGPGAIYHKRNLVPFGEWIPLRAQLLPLVPMLKLVGAQSVPGNGPGVLSGDVPQHGTTRIGVLICFELAYDQTVREMIQGDASTGGGAQLVTVQSNNATYAGTGQISQQWAITRIRAMETQREILVATTNALSGYIAPDGTVVYETHQRTPASTSVVMPVRNGLTPAMRFGAGIELALVAIAVAALAAAAWRSRPARAAAPAVGQNGTAPSS